MEGDNSDHHRRQSVSDIKGQEEPSVPQEMDPEAWKRSLKNTPDSTNLFMKQLRPVKSNPNMSNVERNNLVKTSLINIPSQVMTNPLPTSTRHASLTSSNWSSSRGTDGFNRTSVESVIFNGNESATSATSGTSQRQISPNLEESQSQRHSSPSVAEDETEEEGGHDTITSLAGAKMLQKYRRTLSSGSRASSSASASHNRLEALFKEDLEDIQESDDEEKVLLIPEQPNDIFVPPDGGYGWFVALGAFIALFWCAGMVKSYGVIFKAILVTFPDSSVSLASWIPAGMTSTALVMAPVTSAFCQKYNCRYVTFVGAFTCTLGISLSSLAPNMETLFFTLGILTGMGLGLSTTPGIILTARYFDKNRAKANAFCLSGTAAGSFVLPFFIEACMNTFGFRGAVLILGGCMLHIAISASLYRPLSVHVLIMKNSPAAPEASTKEEAFLSPATVCSHEASRNASQTSSIKSLNSSCSHIPDHHHYGRHPLQHQLLQVPPYTQDPQYMAVSLNQKLHELERRNQAFNPNADLLSLGGSVSSIGFDKAKAKTGYCQESVSSIPCSLPPHLEHQFSVHGSSNASLASNDPFGGIDWNQASPLQTQSPMRELRHIYSGQLQNGQSDPHLSHGSNPMLKVEQAKALSLRELYMHQLGSRLNMYKSIIMGSNPKLNKSQELSQSNRSIGDPHKETDLHRAIHPVRSRTAMDTRPKPKPRRFSFRNSLMFSIEDLSTDSTSILKESRYPSVSEEIDKGHVRRIIPLDRSVSCATPRSSVRVRSRKRTSSEGEPHDGDHDVCHSRFKLRSSPLPSTQEEAEPLTKEVILKAKMEENKPSAEASGTPVTPEVKLSLPRRIMRTVKKYLDVEIVKDPLFIILAISVMGMSFGVPHLLFFLPAHAAPLGIEASSLLAITSIFDLLGRLISGFILDLKLVPTHLFYASVIIVTGLSVVILPFCTTYPAMVVSVGFYGIGAGTWFLMVPLLLSEYLGVERIASSYGMVRFFQSFANLFGPIIGGFLWEYSGSLLPTFVYMGVVMCLGSVAVFFEPLALRRRQRSKDELPK